MGARLVVTFAVMALWSGTVNAEEASHPVMHDSLTGTNEAREAALKDIGSQFVGEVRPLFQRKCGDCHSARTVYPWYHAIPGIKQLIDHDVEEGLEHLDFTDGYPFKGHGTPEEDLEAILEVVKDRSMPPVAYRWMHAESVLSDSDAKTIEKWAEAGLARLRAL